MKSSIVLLVLILSGCSTVPQGYSQYLEQTSKLSASQNAAEAACLLVIAEGMKSGDPSFKAVLASQIDKCRKDPIKIEPPKRNWLGF
jgi:PBP1b-binding outer membrane lipoprotein LpoB